MRRYETTYILRPNLGETLISEIVERTNNIIKNDGGAIIWLEPWGIKKLAYEIKKENHGYYLFLDFAAQANTVQEMERIFNIDDRVLRFLTIKIADSIDQEEIEKETENAAASAEAKSAKSQESEDSDDLDEDDDSDEDDAEDSKALDKK
ncbi:MAG: 30S ribosomal protein S6 [Desulfobulbaceae bacterium]|nr:30S ribosomal protein S6 [Desulfobulbaceae bacterium]